MKTTDDYMDMPYRMEIVEDKTDGGFVVSFPELPGCLTCGETIESAVENAKDAERAWIEAALEDGISIDEPGTPGNNPDRISIRVPHSLHRSLLRHAEKEGVSTELYCLYLLSKNDAAHTGKNTAAGETSRQGGRDAGRGPEPALRREGPEDAGARRRRLFRRRPTVW